jgi:hypothetical protein
MLPRSGIICITIGHLQGTFPPFLARPRPLARSPFLIRPQLLTRISRLPLGGRSPAHSTALNSVPPVPPRDPMTR